MCGGNMRGAIKALIMANEYLEHELEELQALVSGGLTRTGCPAQKARPELPWNAKRVFGARVSFASEPEIAATKRARSRVRAQEREPGMTKRLCRSVSAIP